MHRAQRSRACARRSPGASPARPSTPSLRASDHIDSKEWLKRNCCCMHKCCNCLHMLLQILQKLLLSRVRNWQSLEHPARATHHATSAGSGHIDSEERLPKKLLHMHKCCKCCTCCCRCCRSCRRCPPPQACARGTAGARRTGAGTGAGMGRTPGAVAKAREQQRAWRTCGASKQASLDLAREIK